MEKLLISKREAADALGCSVRTIENMLNRKQLVSRRLGRRRMVTYASLTLVAKHGTPIITGVEPQRESGNAGSAR